MIPAPFEGPEKKLEILLTTPQSRLRPNRDGRWHRVSRASQAAIISSISNASLDAYLLSESSLFVWEDRILMITCGSTTPLDAIPEIMALSGPGNVAMVFYERKNFLFPENQPSDFETDAAVMEGYFPGRSYRFGPANADHVHVFISSPSPGLPEQDVTFQILMSHLPSTVAERYTADNGQNAVRTLQEDILNLYPGMEFDSHLFSPFGTSMNGIRDANYLTVHVTPQREGSYTSFETNVIADDYSDTTDLMVSLFKPQRFSIVLTSSMDGSCLPLHDSIGSWIPGYTITERSLNQFDCGYAMTFLNCIQADSP